MSLAFEDFEKDYPSSEAKQAKNETPTSVVRKPSVGVKPSMSDALSQAWGQVSPMIASGAERAINPIHYKSDQEDYTNIDWPLTALHAGGEAIAAKRIWDFATGKSEERKTAQLNAETNRYNAETARMNSEARGAPLRSAAPVPVPKPAPVQQAAPQAPSLAERTISGPAQTDIPAYLRKQQAAPATPTAPAVPVTPTMSAEQAAARVAEMPEHKNPITKIEPSTLSQIGASNLAADTKEAIAQQKQIQGKTGAAVQPTTPLFETPGIADVIAGAKKPPVLREKMPEGWGKGMTWLVNQHGVEGAKAYIDEFNNGKPFASYEQAMESYKKNTSRPKFTDMPKDVRKSRGIVVPPQTSMRMLSTPMSGGGYRPGVDNLQHSLNPLKM